MSNSLLDMISAVTFIASRAIKATPTSKTSSQATKAHTEKQCIRQYVPILRLDNAPFFTLFGVFSLYLLAS